jgi:hypothetical protein
MAIDLTGNLFIISCIIAQNSLSLEGYSMEGGGPSLRILFLSESDKGKFQQDFGGEFS